MGLFSLPLAILPRVLLCGFLASTYNFKLWINYHSPPLMHPCSYVTQPSLLYSYLCYCFLIIFFLSGFHQGLKLRCILIFNNPQHGNNPITIAYYCAQHSHNLLPQYFISFSFPKFRWQSPSPHGFSSYPLFSSFLFSLFSMPISIVPSCWP